MIDKFIRDIVNLLLYGGAFIGLCAACITALTFELTGDVESQFPYTLLIGVCTSALYSAHRVIGLHKLKHITSFERYTVIRRYKHHIWMYCFMWIAASIWLMLPFFPLPPEKGGFVLPFFPLPPDATAQQPGGFEFLLWLIPGVSVAALYVLPVLPKRRRLRDLGWTKIILIGWSWAWLTAFLPAYFFDHEPLWVSVFLGVERMLFIIAITIPFDIRDVYIDKSVSLNTMPLLFGMKKTLMTGYILCFVIMILAIAMSFYFHDAAYGISMSIISLTTIWFLNISSKITDDYFFSGVTDGLMILALIIYWMI